MVLVMNLAQIATSLRDTSDRYDGIPEYLYAAGELDRAASAFFVNQDIESLAALNSAVARVTRLQGEFSKPMASKTCRIDVVRHVEFRK